MNKRTLCLILAAITLIAVFCGCQAKKDQSPLPEPERTTCEKSANSFGARYTFNLAKICMENNPDVKELGVTLKNADWETISAQLADDNGVSYSSLCNRKNSVTFTAAVENKSKKVMNLGCGCMTEMLKNDPYRESFLEIAAITAQHAGGYREEDRAFLKGIFRRLLEDDGDILVYRDTLYIRSVDEGTTVLITAPCSEEVIDEKQYKEYAG